MEKLYIEATQYTPAIELDSNGVFSIAGKSYSENTFEFYKPVMEWLKEYFDSNCAPETIVNFEITYFNSSSSKLFFDMFDLFLENKDTTQIEINWIYDEEDFSSEEAGEDFQEDFEELDIKLVVKK